MAGRDYWLDLFTGTTWQEFLDHGESVSGFRESRAAHVKKIRPGDYLLCYLTGVSRWIGVLEVLAEPYHDDKNRIWSFDLFPWRMKVKTVVKLTPETGVPVLSMKDRLSIFQNLKTPNAWGAYFRGSPSPFSTGDGEAVVAAVQEAAEDPVVRPVDPAKLRRRPAALKSKIGPVTIPETEEPEATREATPHTETQWMLLKVGSELGLDLWVARTDRNREYDGTKLCNAPGVLSELPVQFDEVTRRVIENIDVLWLQGKAIAAAFEVECTTAIYSGLLRMSDLVAMQPNLSIPIYIVAPGARREKVMTEVNRPTFTSLAVPLYEICSFIPLEDLKEHVSKYRDILRYMKPDFLEELAESCQPEDVDET